MCHWHDRKSSFHAPMIQTKTPSPLFPLQKVEELPQVGMRRPVDRLSNQVGQLVGILDRGGDPDSSGPIVIGVAEFEAD